jgi:hypothetical protein
MNRLTSRFSAVISALTAISPLVTGALGLTTTVIVPTRIALAAPFIQDDKPYVEAAKSSQVAGLPLPSGAFRLLQQDAVDELTKGMRTTAEEGGFTLGKVEGIIWGGKDHTTARNQEIEKEVIASFKMHGYRYEKVGDKTQDGLKMTLFIAGKPNSKVAILGFYAPNEQGFLLGMARIAKKGTPLTDEPGTSNAGADEPAAPSKPAAGGKKLPAAEQKRVDAAIEKAIESRDAAQVKTLLAKGANPNGRAGEQSFLMRAVIWGNLEMVTALLEAGADPDFGNGTSIAPLFTAALVNELTILDALLEKGADPNAQLPDNGYTPLHGAAINGNTEAIEKLLEKGADANIKDKSGRKASKIAEASKHTAAAEVLKKAEEKGEGG